jgi:hypothetical protein
MEPNKTSCFLVTHVIQLNWVGHGLGMCIGEYKNEQQQCLCQALKDCHDDQFLGIGQLWFRHGLGIVIGHGDHGNVIQ